MSWLGLRSVEGKYNECVGGNLRTVATYEATSGSLAGWPAEVKPICRIYLKEVNIYNSRVSEPSLPLLKIKHSNIVNDLSLTEQCAKHRAMHHAKCDKEEENSKQCSVLVKGHCKKSHLIEATAQIAND